MNDNEHRTAITNEAVEQVAFLVERFWNDVAGLPWKDKAWLRDQAAMDAAKQHFTISATQDITEVMIDMFTKLGGSYADSQSEDSTK